MDVERRWLNDNMTLIYHFHLFVDCRQNNKVYNNTVYWCWSDLPSTYNYEYERTNAKIQDHG